MDDRAFGHVYIGYKHRLVRFAGGVLGDPQLAEDVAHETLLKAATKLPDGMQDPWPWLRKVARNHCLDIIKARREQPRADLPDLAGAMGSESEVERLEVIQAVEHAISTLPATHQETLKLAYWEELSYEDIAHRLNTTKASVRDRLHYAKILLSSKLRSLKDLGCIILPGISGKKMLLQRALKEFVKVAVVSTVSVMTVAVLSPPVSFIEGAEEGGTPTLRPDQEIASNSPAPIISVGSSMNPHDVSKIRNSPNYRVQVSNRVSVPQGPDTPAGNSRGSIGPVTVHCDPSSTGPVVSHVCGILLLVSNS